MMVGGVIFLCLLLVNLYLVIFTITVTRRLLPIIVAVILLVVSYLILNAFLMDVSWLSWSRPVYVIVFSLILLTMLGLLVVEWRYANRAITRASIKEAIDNLPMGLSFSRPSGMITLANRYMNNLNFELSGEDLQNNEALWELVRSGESSIQQLTSGEAWVFSRQEIVVNRRLQIQLVASNISELANLRSQLASKNEELAGLNKRLRQYSVDLATTKVQEERVATKARIHSELGHLLLATRRKLTQPEITTSDLDILDQWRDYLIILESGVEVDEGNGINTLLQSAAALGVKLAVAGEIPEDYLVRELVIKATLEALNNAVRHADATELTLAMSETAAGYKITLTNNGRLEGLGAGGTITEGGGLTVLRKQVESLGGELAIVLAPAFAIQISIPVKARRS